MEWSNEPKVIGDIERFSIECRNSQSEERKIPLKSQWEVKVKPTKNDLSAGIRGRPSRDWFLALHLIGWKFGLSFLDQSQSEVKQKQSKPGLFSTLN